MQEYIKYFSGLKRNYGVCKTTEGFVDGETGKKRYPHEWSSIPVVEQDYLDHLSGVKSIGIQPCTDEGKARFGAIDVDKYPIDRKFYLDIIQEKKLPIIPVLSKSGGLHLYIFTKEAFDKTNARIGANPMMYETPNFESIDIDTPDDWDFAIAIGIYLQGKIKATNKEQGASFIISLLK